MVPLRQVVEFVPSFSPQVLKRQALERRVAVYAGLEGRPLGDVMGDVNKAMKAIDLPDGVRFDVGGDAQQMDETMAGFGVALGIAVIFIYLVLASQFGSFLQPIAIMVSLPLSLIGVLLALLVTKTHAEHLLGDRRRDADGPGDQERDPAGGLRQPRPARRPAQFAR
jgi:multidrug efflux pump subunit AcrB